MSPEDSSKSLISSFRWLVPGLLLLMAALVNPWTLDWVLGRLLDNPEYSYPSLQRQLPFIGTLCLLWPLVSTGWVLRQEGGLKGLWGHSPGWNAFNLLCGLLLHMLVTPIAPADFRGLRLLGLAVLMVLTLRVLWLLVVRPKRKGWKAQSLLGIGAVLLLLLLLESVFLFVARSHQTWETYAAAIWRKRHWRENEQGFRDGDWEEKLKKKGARILLLGDSFSAGAGIADPKQRFGDLLDEKMGEEATVFSLAYPGWGPEQEYAALRDFPEKPDLVVLAWYVNDIHGALEEQGIYQDQFNRFGQKREPHALSLVDGSYLSNYLYWLYPHGEAHNNYMDYLKAGYADPAVLDRHFAALDSIIAFCNEREIPMVSLLFPLMREPEASHFALDPVEAHFSAKDVPCLSLLPLFSGENAADWVVNANDAHPNEAAHATVAESLYSFLQKRGLIPN